MPKKIAAIDGFNLSVLKWKIDFGPCEPPVAGSWEFILNGISRLAALLCFMTAAAGAAHAEDRSPFRHTVRDGIGVNIHFTDPKPGEMDMLAGSGLRWVRMDLGWDATEKQKGVYDFSRYDTLMANLSRKNMRALLILDYSNAVYGPGGKPPYDDEGRAAFARWAVAAVKHFRGKGVLWELWNEPNGAWFWPNPRYADYAKLDLAVDRAVHDAYPAEVLIGPATSGIDLAFLEGCFKAGCLQYWDAVSVHPYRQTNPEDAGGDYIKLRALISKYAPAGKTIPILAAEWGYSVSWGGYSDELQGKYLVREFLFNQENDIPLTIWYDWHDDGPDPRNAEHNFGTVRYEYHEGRNPIYDPKPAYSALRTLTKSLDGFSFDARLTTGYPITDHILVFKRDQERRYAVWRTSKSPHAARLPLPAGNYTLIDRFGTEHATAADITGLPVLLTDTPQYVTP